MVEEKKYYVYILECSDKTFYTGFCLDLKKRLRQHNGEINGGAKYTRYKRPVRLVYFEEFGDRSSAQKREVKIKKLKRIEKIDLTKKLEK